MKHIRKNSMAVNTGLLFLLVCTNALANTSNTTHTISFVEKDVHIAKIKDSNKRYNHKFVNITVTPSKKAYKVKEPMKFTIVGKNDFYLYVFNITNNTNTLLFPNIKTKSNFFRAQKRYEIPRNVYFYSDKAGEEQMLFIATNNLLQLDTKLLGDTVMLSENSSEIDSNSYELEDLLSEINSYGQASESIKPEPRLLKIKVYR